MEKYKVLIRNGLQFQNQFVKPAFTIEVEVEDGTSEDDIVKKALSKMGAYPKTHTTQVIPIN